MDKMSSDWTSTVMMKNRREQRGKMKKKKRERERETPAGKVACGEAWRGNERVEEKENGVECRGEEERAAVRDSHTRLMCFVASSRCVAWTDARSDGLTLREGEGQGRHSNNDGQ